MLVDTLFYIFLSPLKNCFQVNVAIAAQMNAFVAIGLTEKQLTQMREWAKTRSVTIRLRAEEKCKFLRKVRGVACLFGAHYIAELFLL